MITNDDDDDDDDELGENEPVFNIDEYFFV